MRHYSYNIDFKAVFNFIIVLFSTACLFQVVDSGLISYFHDMNYIKQEGFPFWAYIVFKLIFVAGIVFLLMAKNVLIRFTTNCFIFITLWLAALNLLINRGSLNEGVVKVAMGDASSYNYFWSIVDLFQEQFTQAGIIAFVIILVLIFIQSHFLPRITSWKAVLPIFIICLGYFGARGPGYLITEMPVPIKIPGMVYSVLQKNHYYGPRDKVTFTPKSKGVKNLVFIVDESVRGDLLSINGFEKPTTPYLNSVIGKYFNYGVTSSASNCSGSSNILLQTGLTDKHVPDTKSRILKAPSLFQYAKKAGYKTFYIPVRGTPDKFSDFMTKYDFTAIDQAKYIKHSNPERPRYEADLLLEQEIVKIIKHYPNEKVFIYALKEGSHFLYKDAYPAKKSFFPDQSGDGLKDLRNSYFNALVWGVDKFFENLLHDLKDVNTTIVYTSDHGQGLGEEGDPSTHCKPTMPHQSQGNVPLILLTTKNDKNHLRKLAQPMFRQNVNHASHFNVFPSLLVLMGYEQLEVNSKYPKTIFQNLENQKRFFLSGDLWNKVQKTQFIGKKTYISIGNIESFIIEAQSERSK